MSEATRRALLLVDHGSRLPEAHAHLEALAARVSALLPDWSVRVAHMEGASPSIDEAIDACAREGAREVVVHPLFLVPGRHLSEDVPRLVERAAKRHAGLHVRISEPIGASPDLAALIVRTALPGREPRD